MSNPQNNPCKKSDKVLPCNCNKAANTEDNEQDIRIMTTTDFGRYIADNDEWDPDALLELTRRADMLDEYIESTGETFEAVVCRAAEKLGISLWPDVRYR